MELADAELASVRYTVDDGQESIDFNVEHFGFELRRAIARAR